MVSTLSTMPVVARCRPDGPPVTTEMIDAFISKPALLLLSDATSRRDADAMSVSVSQYVAADTSAMPALVSVLPQASLDQRVAIGRGLYRVVSVCAAVDQAVVQRTETALRKIGDVTVVDAYRDAEAMTLESAAPASGGDLWAGTHPSTVQPPTDGSAIDTSMSLKLSDPFAFPEDRRSW